MQLYSFRTVSDAVFLLVALTLAVSSFLLIASTLVDHLRNYKYPSLQACCMRILLLAPIYAVVSWFMMVFLPVSGYIEVLRDVYEGYALYCFWVMLVLWCGGQRKVIEVMGREDKLACFLCPLVQGCGCGVPVFRWSSAASLFRFLRVAVTQLMVVKPVVAMLCAAIATSGAPGGHPRIRHLRLLVLLSTAIAMHAIFTVYMATKPYIRGLQASKKFVLLKGVVATILLQQFAVNAALSMEVIPEGDYGYTAEDRAKRMYCTLTIMEMAVFSLLLSYSFSHTSMALPDASAGLKGGPKGGSKAHPMSPPTGDSADTSSSPTQTPLPNPSSQPATAGFFELVIGDSSSSATRKLAATLPHPEAVSLLPVLAFWDVVVMGRIEEASAAPSGSAGGSGVPVESDGVSLINSRDLESAGICMHDLVKLGAVQGNDGDLGGVCRLPQAAAMSPSRPVPLQRYSTGCGGTLPAVVTTEEGMGTRDSHACNVSTGASAMSGGWGLSLVSLPRHAAKAWNKR